MATPETAPSNINRLQELFMQRQLPLPQYEFGSSGPMHMPKFTAQVRIVVGSGADDMYVIPAVSAYSKKTDAKSAAAYAALLELSKRGWVAPPEPPHPTMYGSAHLGYGAPLAGGGGMGPPGGFGYVSAPPPRGPPHVGGGPGMGWPPPRADANFAPAHGAAYFSSPPSVGAALRPDAHLSPGLGGGAAFHSAPPAVGAAPPTFVASSRVQPSLEALERVVLIDINDVRAATSADYAPAPGDFVVAFSAVAEDPAATLGAALPGSVVRAPPGSAPGSTDVMLLAWVYKFLERHGQAVAEAMIGRTGGGRPSLPVFIVSPSTASAPATTAGSDGTGSSAGHSLVVAASVLESDVDYAHLGLRVAVVPSTRSIPLPSWPHEQPHRTHFAPPGPGY